VSRLISKLPTFHQYSLSSQGLVSCTILPEVNDIATRLVDCLELARLTIASSHTHSDDRNAQRVYAWLKPFSLNVGHYSSVGELILLTVCPPHGPGSILSLGGEFQRTFP